MLWLWLYDSLIFLQLCKLSDQKKYYVIFLYNGFIQSSQLRTSNATNSSANSSVDNCLKLCVNETIFGNITYNELHV